MISRQIAFGVILLSLAVIVSNSSGSALIPEDDESISAAQLQLVKALEQKRISAIEKVIGSVVAVYDEQRGGGGSGVIIDPSGIALTNHHVIIGAGVQGWGGIADGNLYRWKLIGTDPGGDVAIIQLEGDKPFPYTPLGDSDTVQVGDWALAMGNPFILTEDQKPTVTLGIVSGVKRYQPGAGQNQLVYGNCIQVDSSINPGNSGGPLFNLNGEVIGINGRGSFKARGRVNVGLGYAISANQIKNFIPDLLATKLVEHATIDASFTDRGGKVICSTINQDSPAAQKGLDLGDELLEFEGIPIINAHQYTNLICTLPEDWPVSLKVRDTGGNVKTIVVRALGLPYARPRGGVPKPKKDSTPEERKRIQRQKDMIELLAATPGTIRNTKVNQKYMNHVLHQWRSKDGLKREKEQPMSVLRIDDDISKEGKRIGSQSMWLSTKGHFRVEVIRDNSRDTYIFDGEKFGHQKDENDFKEMTLTQAKLALPVVQAASILATSQEKPFAAWGRTFLDGSDKALGTNAYRMKILDPDDDWFFYWLRMYDESGRPAPRITKASAELDCDQNDGGVVFENWEESSGWMIPKTRRTVFGLSETTTSTISTAKTQVAENFPVDKFSFQSDSKNNEVVNFNEY